MEVPAPVWTYGIANRVIQGGPPGVGCGKAKWPSHRIVTAHGVCGQWTVTVSLTVQPLLPNPRPSLPYISPTGANGESDLRAASILLS